MKVTIFDKARGAGGRSSTRRGDGLAFDHGAQYFTARDPKFIEQVEDWQRAGHAREWLGRIVHLDAEGRAKIDKERRFVGVPGMSSIARQLAAGCELRNSFKVEKITRDGKEMRLLAEDCESEAAFDAVVLAAPAPQAAALAVGLAPTLADKIGSVRFAPCWAVMLDFDAPLAVDFDGAFIEDPAISWMARNSSKPERPPRECWVLHATGAWSEAQLESDPETVKSALLTAFADRLAIRLPAGNCSLHRWAYALPLNPLADPCLWDPAANLGACGDWCAGPRVEGAYLSGLAMARRLLEACRPAT